MCLKLKSDHNAFSLLGKDHCIVMQYSCFLSSTLMDNTVIYNQNCSLLTYFNKVLMKKHTSYMYSISRMAKAHPDDYAFVPRTWILPSEYSQLQAYAKEIKKKKKSRTFIVKPANGAMGNGYII